MESIPRPPFTKTTRVRSWGSIGDGQFGCVITPDNSDPVSRGGSYTFGETVTRDGNAPYKGNHVLALPYWSEVYKIEEPTGSFTQENATLTRSSTSYNVCDGYNSQQRAEWNIPAGSIDLPLPPLSSMPPEFSNSDRHFVQKVAETKAVNKLRRGVASLPMVWFERAATIANAKQRINDMVDIATKRQQSDLAGYRKIKGRNAKKRFARKMANDHLEMIFGWLPLLDDIEGLAEYVNEPRRDFVRANGKHSIVLNSSTRVDGSERSIGLEYVAVQKTTTSLGARCALRATITSRLFNNFRQVGFQPVYSLYDAVPLSFVLGWASNFGSWIGTFDPLYGVEFTTGSTNVRTRKETHIDAYGTGYVYKDTGSVVSLSKSSGRMEQYVSIESNVRTVLSEEPSREFFFMNNLSIYSILASLSLAVQKKLKVAKPLFKDSPFRLGKGKPRRVPPNLPLINYTGTKV